MTQKTKGMADSATPTENHYKGSDNITYSQDSLRKNLPPAAKDLDHKELDTLSAILSEPKKPVKTGMIKSKRKNQSMREATELTDPKRLWDEFLYEGELACLFADSNLGKSIYAVQIGNEIAKSQNVVYFDFELSDKQDQLRYTDDSGECYWFSQNLYRAVIDPMEIPDGDFSKALLEDIEDCAIANKARVLIIDNLTWMDAESEKGANAAELMRKLMALKLKYDWTMLVIAHTPKRNPYMPITANDLAGSRKLFNFFDSVFAIGKSAKDPDLRYIKQIKCRSGAFKYNEDNVILAQIVKDGAWLHFDALGCCRECDLLQQRTDQDRTEVIAKVQKLHAEGMSLRAIAKELGISHMAVKRVLDSNPT